MQIPSQGPGVAILMAFSPCPLLRATEAEAEAEAEASPPKK